MVLGLLIGGAAVALGGTYLISREVNKTRTAREQRKEEEAKDPAVYEQQASIMSDWSNLIIVVVIGLVLMFLLWILFGKFGGFDKIVKVVT